MPALPLVFAPNPVFRKKAAKVAENDTEIRQLVADMFETLYHEKGVGIGANMVGILKQVIVVDLQEGGTKTPIAMINPVILQISEDLQTFNEASLSFPGISAEITRPSALTVQFADENREIQTLQAEGFLATVIQHEMDYLAGRTFLDHLSRTKRDTLMRKYHKQRRQFTLR